MADTLVARQPNHDKGYRDAHHRARRLLGDASGHTCIACPRRAHDWAYQHTAGPNERRTPEGTPYSDDPADYKPMCRSCHPKHDLAHDASRATRWAKTMAKGMATVVRKRHEDRAFAVREQEYLHRGRQLASTTVGICEACGRATTLLALGRHQAATGHEGVL